METLFITLVGVAAVVAGALWPRHGLVAMWNRLHDLTQRERVEHALKHLHHSEVMKTSCTLASLAGILHVSRQQATELAGQLEAAGLMTTSGGLLKLTPPGRSEALRVIRIHRLWETYFADQTGLSESLWHDEADRREHRTIPETVETLAVKLGHPRFDPHGAPIPTSSGELPTKRWESLTELPPGQTGRVVHVEDEPKAVYEQLLAQDLTIGTIVEVVENTPARIRLEIDGTEQALAPVIAGNISVERVDPVADSDVTSRRLSALSPGEKARVLGLLPACRGVQRRRLLDLGLISGTVVEAELRSAAGDPTAYRIRGALIALRKDQSRLVQIERLAPKK